MSIANEECLKETIEKFNILCDYVNVDYKGIVSDQLTGGGQLWLP